MRSKEITLNGRELIVYEDGRVYRKAYTFTDSMGRTYTKDGKFLSVFKHSSKYKGVKIGETFVLLHRLIALAFIPNPDSKPCVNHKNCDKFDNRIENLEWNSYSENTTHAYKMGVMSAVKGVNHVRNKYSEETILYIKRLLSEGKHTQKRISEMANVPVTLVADVKQNRSWSHLTLKEI